MGWFFFVIVRNAKDDGSSEQGAVRSHYDIKGVQINFKIIRMMNLITFTVEKSGKPHI